MSFDGCRALQRAVKLKVDPSRSRPVGVGSAVQNRWAIQEAPLPLERCIAAESRGGRNALAGVTRNPWFNVGG